MVIDKSKAWFEKYRAKTLDEYIFPNDEIKKFAENVKNNKIIPGNVILFGKPGTGKTNLAQILIREIIGNSADLFIIRDRSVSEIDEIKKWIKRKPINSKQKIVLCEEADRLARSKQAVAELKTITEKYIPETIFFFITNYISQIDPALLTRFTIKFEFNDLPLEKVIDKIEFILKNEGVEYNKDELFKYVSRNISSGLRDLINNIQLMSLSGKLIINEDILMSSYNEEKVIKLVKSFVDYIQSISNRNYLVFLLNTTNIVNDKNIGHVYQELIAILQNDRLLSYTTIYERLLEEIDFIPFKKVVIEYYQTNDDKKFKHLHLISMLYDIMKSWGEFLNV